MIYLVYYRFGPVGLLDVYYRTCYYGEDTKGYFDISISNIDTYQMMIGDVRILCPSL